MSLLVRAKSAKDNKSTKLPQISFSASKRPLPLFFTVDLDFDHASDSSKVDLKAPYMCATRRCFGSKLFTSLITKYCNCYKSFCCYFVTIPGTWIFYSCALAHSVPYGASAFAYVEVEWSDTNCTQRIKAIFSASSCSTRETSRTTFCLLWDKLP